MGPGPGRLAKWGLGSRDLTAQTNVLILRTRIFQIHSRLLPSRSSRWGLGFGAGPREQHNDWMAPAWAQPQPRAQIIFLFHMLSATLEPEALLPTHSP